ncbi:siderophore-interacting protein [Herbiconiux sp. SYSU D00978]|uniref:siderophore-interacting protein n=1 Tax=Herbiconiux sp. SYSU D00978 TaxID=2812562 RepID=UPI0027DB7836|nr:siderophore-interacting protein [Herbiconiux sp. SYSU D00978]
MLHPLSLGTDERVRDERPAYRPYLVTIGRLTRLSPSFMRVTFVGDELEHFGTAGLDQRIKLVLPHPDGHPLAGGYGDCGFDRADDGWFVRWRELPDELRNPFRTYTVRAVRQHAREVDVDVVVHGDAGPASRWIQRARIGDALVMIGPDDRSLSWRTGLDWRCGGATEVLLAGDETAAPAIASILESRPAGVHATAFIEVPHADDVLPITSDAELDVHWLVRDGRPHGELLLDAVTRWTTVAAPLLDGARGPALEPVDDIDVDLELLWDSPEEQARPFYAWLAGESSVIKRLRRLLVSDLGVDRSKVAFMGYWRAGRAEGE